MKKKEFFCNQCANKGWYKCGYEGLFIEYCNCVIGKAVQEAMINAVSSR